VSLTLDENERISLASYQEVELKSVGHVDGTLAELAKLQAAQLKVLLSIDQRLNELCDYITWRDAERIKNQ
jgi:hypothetical protein